MLLTLLSVSTGAVKIARMPEEMEIFRVAGFPDALTIAFGVVQLGLGLLLLFVEFKTPGFGLFGIAGLVLVGIVFASNYLAGLAGFEAILFFILGLAFIVVDIFLLPGTFIFLTLGILLILGSLLWSLSDIWPAPDGGGPGGFAQRNQPPVRAALG